VKKHITIIFILVVFISIMPVLAKGEFDYLVVKGPGIQGEINVTNPELTGDFFIFADFTLGEILPPADPGEGYEITRVYVVTINDKPTAKAFDQLIYFPYADDGYVYYVGLADGSSDYDGKWFVANPSANTPFRATLAERARLNWIPFAVLIVILSVFFFAYRGKPKSTQ